MEWARFVPLFDNEESKENKQQNKSVQPNGNSHAEMAIYFAKNINSMNRALIGYSNHYHATWMKKRPYWAKGQKPVKVIGQHAFYKL